MIRNKKNAFSKVTLWLPPLHQKNESYHFAMAPLTGIASSKAKLKKSPIKGIACLSPFIKYNPLPKPPIVMKGSSMSLESILLNDYKMESNQEKDTTLLKMGVTNPSHVAKKFKRNTILKYIQNSSLQPYSQVRRYSPILLNK